MFFLSYAISAVEAATWRYPYFAGVIMMQPTKFLDIFLMKYIKMLTNTKL